MVQGKLGRCSNQRVPLDKTCQYEYEISIAHSIVSTNTDRGSIVINHRIGLNLVYPECNCDDFHLKKLDKVKTVQKLLKSKKIKKTLLNHIERFKR